MEVFDDKFRTFEIASKAGLLGRMFGRHSSDQNLALPISTIGLMNAGNVWMSERFTQSTALIDTGAPHSQAQQLHCQVKEQSSRSCDDGMEFDDESPQRNLSNSPATMGSRQKLLREGMQASGGLMRYHSAPSSMLASLVEVGEDFFPHVSSPLRHNGDTEFAQLFVDDLKTSATNCEKRSLQQTQKPLAGSDLNGEQMLAKQLDRTRMLHQQSRYKRPLVNGVSEDGNLSPLSAIYEHGPDISPGNFCGTQMSATCNQQGARAGLAVGMGNLASQRSSCNPLVKPATSYSSLPQNKTNLIRHSSSPAGLLSRLAMEVQGESCEIPTPCFSGPMMHHPPECLSESASKEICFSSACRVPGLSPAFSERSCFGASIAAETSDDIITSDGRFMALSPSSKSRLVRQSSSPAGLLSQMSPDGIAEGGDKLMMPSSSGNSAEESNFDGRGGPAVFLTNYAAGNWDEHVAATGSIIGMQNDTAFAARKRVRELESKMFPGLTLSVDSQQMDDFDHGGSLASQFGMAGTTSPENGVTADKFPSDYVTCRARAKRGCATHPRSIAERVRRTKISERMRKLQELVPNMDKQTNTADMLDEAVEYVKLLQRQVKELSENRPKCDGCCRQKGNDPHQD